MFLATIPSLTSAILVASFFAFFDPDRDPENTTMGKRKSSSKPMGPKKVCSLHIAVLKTLRAHAKASPPPCLQLSHAFSATTRTRSLSSLTRRLALASLTAASADKNSSVPSTVRYSHLKPRAHQPLTLRQTSPLRSMSTASGLMQLVRPLISRCFTMQQGAD